MINQNFNFIIIIKLFYLKYLKLYLFFLISKNYIIIIIYNKNKILNKY